ncbi:MAG: hypothetical protein M3352_04815 [Bacteroidota bacterium]|nr:hypothetical protein [Bacteroidota bacterium]
MPGSDLKEKLINKIRQTEDEALLEEISQLIQLQEPETIYTLNNDQKRAVQEGKDQIKNNQFFSNEEADKNIDEWLNQ